MRFSVVVSDGGDTIVTFTQVIIINEPILITPVFKTNNSRGGLMGWLSVYFLVCFSYGHFMAFFTKGHW
jgi:hypothetical protein